MKTSSLATNLLLLLVPLRSTTGFATTLQSRPTATTALNLQTAFSSALFAPGRSAPREPLNDSRHSASDWLYNVRSIRQSDILREVQGPCIAVAGWSAVVSVLYKVLPSGLASNLCIPCTVHSFLVSALGLLLVFRTNSAYQRFYVRDEIRKTGILGLESPFLTLLLSLF
jgi:hypothetical protein